VKRTLVGVSVALAMCTAGLAQAPPPAPKPGAEHKAIAYFVGKWTAEGEMKASPLGPGGKMTSSDTCEAFAGGFQVVCRGKGNGPMGAMTSLGILGYNGGEKAYTYYGIDSTGMADYAKGQKSGETWTFESTTNMNGQSIKSRYTMVESSPTAYTFKWEMSKDGTTWSTVAEGKATKAAATKTTKPTE